MKKRHRDRPDLPDPADVLNRRVVPSCRQLLALIREVNPVTGEGSERERERYVLKSRLQSLLITTFPDEVRAERDETNPGLVLLTHRSGLEHACHALLAQLSEEARALVMRFLDQDSALDPLPERGEPGQPARGKGRRGEGREAAARPAGNALERGREALAAFDFEEAQRLFTLALDEVPGTEAVRELLELQLDVFSSHADALQTAERLSPASLEDPEIRGLVAEAYAGAGMLERALRLVRELSGPRAAAVQVSAARAALSREDRASAREHLDRARTCDPANSSLQDLAGEIAKRERLALEVEEAFLLARLESGGGENREKAAEEAAASLLGRWPSSAAARRVLSEIESRRRVRHIAALEHAGAAALMEGDPEKAMRLLRQVERLEPGRAGVAELLARAEAGARKTHEDSEVNRVLMGLLGELSVNGLQAYVELPPALRERVRGASRLTHLSVVDEIVSGRSLKSKVVAESVLALLRAEALIESGDPEAAIHALEGHEPVLRFSPFGRESHERIHHLAITRRIETHQLLLAEAREALARGDLIAAESKLASARGLESDAVLEEETRSLSAELAESFEIASLERSHDKARDSCEFLSAKRLALKLAERVPEEARPAWREKAARDLEDLRTCSRVLVSDEPSPPEELCELAPSVIHPESLPLLLPGGLQAVIAECFEKWIFLRVIDTRTGVAARKISLRLDRPAGESLGQAVEGSGWIYAGARGGFLWLDLDSGTILESGAYSRLFPDGMEAQQAPYLSSASSWVVLGSRDGFGVHFALVDLQERRVSKSRATGYYTSAVYRGAESLVLATESGRTEILRAEGGSVAAPSRCLPFQIMESAPAPEGSAILYTGQHFDSTTWAPESADDDPGTLANLRLSIFDPKGDQSQGETPPVVLEESDADRLCGLATSRREGATFLVSFVEFGDSARNAFLRRLRCEDGRPVAEKPVRVPEETALLHDRESQDVVAISLLSTGVWIERLKLDSVLKEIPEGQERPLRHDLPPAGSDLRFRCAPRDPFLNARALAICASLGHQVPSKGWMKHQLAEDLDAAGLLATGEAMFKLTLDSRMAQPFYEAAAARFPGDSRVVAKRVLGACENGDWEVARSLVGKPLEGVPPAIAKHALHVEAHALVEAGDFEGALGLLEEASRIVAVGCGCRPLFEFVSAAVHPEAPTASVPATLLSAMARADAAIAHGTFTVAVETLDTALIWATETIQAHARLANAWANVEPSDTAGRFRRRRALARYLQLSSDRQPFGSLPPFPGALSPAALEVIRARVQAVLDEPGA